MAISMGAALLGSAVLGAGSSILGSRSQSRAADRAAETSLANTRENNALAREFYDRNSANFQPYMQGGQSAFNALNSILGINTPTGAGTPPVNSSNPFNPVPTGAGSPTTEVGRALNYMLSTLTPAQRQQIMQMQGGEQAKLEATFNLAPPAAVQAFSAYQQNPTANPLPTVNPQTLAPPPQVNPGTATGSGRVTNSPDSGSFLPPNFQQVTSGGPLTSGSLSQPAPNVGDYTPRTTNALTSQRLTMADIDMPEIAAYRPIETRVTQEAIGPTERLTSSFIGSAMNPGSLTDYNESTAYDWRISEGNKAINEGYAARGALQSGAAQEALMELNQNIAAQGYNDYINQLDRYLSYNDAFAVGERAYQDSREDYGRDYRFRTGAYLDDFAQEERNYGDSRSDRAYDAAFAERGYQDAFNRYERDYGDAFNFRERGYLDDFGFREQQYADSRDDYARAFELTNRNYQDAFNFNERAYGDSRADLGRNNYLAQYGDYLNRLTQQQGMGLTAASALAGVGQNFVSQTTANNNAAAQTAANAALASGQATAGMWTGIGSAVGNALGQYTAFGNYGKPAGTVPASPYQYGGGYISPYAPRW